MVFHKEKDIYIKYHAAKIDKDNNVDTQEQKEEEKKDIAREGDRIIFRYIFSCCGVVKLVLPYGLSLEWFC